MVQSKISLYVDDEGYLITQFKGAVTDMRYFARSNFSRSLVHRKNFSLI